MARPADGERLAGGLAPPAGQLDAELAASSWLMAPADPRLVFETDPDAMWEHAIRGLGVDPMALAPAPGTQ